MTKLSTAVEIVKLSADKQEAMAKIMEELGVTKSNAFVYWTKATKALGSAPVVKTEKVEKARKTNPVTGTTPEKARAKIAEIDNVIAGLKASGATVASPFAGL